MQKLDHGKLREIAEKATPHDLDSAERVQREDDHDCPLCEGEGLVPGTTWTNFDGAAVGIQVFGIGEAMAANEAFVRAFTPAVVLALLSEHSVLTEEVERLEQTCSALHSTGEELCGRIVGLEASNERMRKALEPFATAFDVASADGPCISMAGYKGMRNAVDIQSFRQASQALSGLTGEGTQPSTLEEGGEDNGADKEAEKGETPAGPDIEMVATSLRAVLAAEDLDTAKLFAQVAMDYATNDLEALAEGKALSDA